MTDDISQQEYDAIPTAPSSRRRGRPKKEDAEVLAWSIRLAPCDGEEIDFAQHIKPDDFPKFIAGREVGKENGELHYHIYAETPRSDTYLKTLFYKMARWTPHYPVGNSVFSKKTAHSNTKNYLVKEEDVAFQHGFTTDELDAMVERHREYRRDLESAKKARTRKTQNTLKNFTDEAILWISENWDASLDRPRSIAKFILSKYNEGNLPFPSRSQLENAVLRAMYKFDPDYVLNQYTKFFGN